MPDNLSDAIAKVLVGFTDQTGSFVDIAKAIIHGRHYAPAADWESLTVAANQIRRHARQHPELFHHFRNGRIKYIGPTRPAV